MNSGFREPFDELCVTLRAMRAARPEAFGAAVDRLSSSAQGLVAAALDPVATPTRVGAARRLTPVVAARLLRAACAHLVRRLRWDVAAAKRRRAILIPIVTRAADTNRSATEIAAALGLHPGVVRGVIRTFAPELAARRLAQRHREHSLWLGGVRIRPELVEAGARVRQRRIDAGWSINDLAARSGLLSLKVDFVEQARHRPHLADVVALGDALGAVDALISAFGLVAEPLDVSRARARARIEALITRTGMTEAELLVGAGLAKAHLDRLHEVGRAPSARTIRLIEAYVKDIPGSAFRYDEMAADFPELGYPGRDDLALERFAAFAPWLSTLQHYLGVTREELAAQTGLRPIDLKRFVHGAGLPPESLLDQLLRGAEVDQEFTVGAVGARFGIPADNSLRAVRHLFRRPVAKARLEQDVLFLHRATLEIDSTAWSELTNEIAKINLGLLDAIVYRHRAGGDREEAYALALEAMTEALDTYEPGLSAHGFPIHLDAIVGYWIREWRAAQIAPGSTQGTRARFLQVRRATEELTHSLGRRPTVPELATYLNSTEATVRRWGATTAPDTDIFLDPRHSGNPADRAAEQVTKLEVEAAAARAAAEATSESMLDISLMVALQALPESVATSIRLHYFEGALRRRNSGPNRYASRGC